MKKIDVNQSDKSIEQNITFFHDNIERYNNHVQQLDAYMIMRTYINHAIQGIDKLLDIGNGGVFDYDTTLVNHIMGLDLFLDKLSPTKYPSNVSLKQGSALAIPENNSIFDGVLMVMLIHHLTGDSVKSCIKNVEIAINEAYRVLKPGGKMIIVESCVPNWFYQFEKYVFPLVAKFINKVTDHPATLQYPIFNYKKNVR